MEITSIKIKKSNSANPKVLGVASIQLDNCLMIHGLTLVQLKDKRIVRFPSVKTEYSKLNINKDGYERNQGYLDIVHPCTTQLRQYIEEVIFKLYDEQVVGNE